MVISTVISLYQASALCCPSLSDVAQEDKPCTQNMLAKGWGMRRIWALKLPTRAGKRPWDYEHTPHKSLHPPKHTQIPAVSTHWPEHRHHPGWRRDMMRGTTLRDNKGKLLCIFLEIWLLWRWVLPTLRSLSKSFPRCLSFPRRRKPVALHGVREYMVWLWSLLRLFCLCICSHTVFKSRAQVTSHKLNWDTFNLSDMQKLIPTYKTQYTTKVCAAWTCLAGAWLQQMFLLYVQVLRCRLNVMLTEGNLTFPFAWTLPLESGMGGVKVGEGLGMVTLPKDRGHSCGELRLWSPGGSQRMTSNLC